MPLAVLEKQPQLPAARNRLLGRWETSTRLPAGGGRNDMGPIEYRAGADGAVFGLPAKGSIFALLPFEFDTPDQVHLVGVVCTLKRAGTAAPSGRK